ncbi:MAG: hypothetical protein HYU69_13435 [Bacteroidetes bacterium]|nr:hypothetical protein [Bacteroidota bacterium]
MKETIEISFEDIRLEKIVEFFISIHSESTLINYQFSIDESISLVNIKSNLELFKFFNTSSDGSFYFNFSNFKLGEFELPEIGIQLMKYNNKYDLNFHFGYQFLRNIAIIQNWAGALAQELKAKIYYCGYEPANDLETRFFTGSILGPLKYSGGDHI